jgi:hypothetical protein
VVSFFSFLFFFFSVIDGASYSLFFIDTHSLFLLFLSLVFRLACCVCRILIPLFAHDTLISTIHTDCTFATRTRSSILKCINEQR